ncbi:MmyB family transcriptional regulator [Streptomyces canus]
MCAQRSSTGPGDRSLIDLFAELRSTGEEFARLWDDGAVGRHVSARRTIVRPQVVEVTCDWTCSPSRSATSASLSRRWPRVPPMPRSWRSYGHERRPRQLLLVSRAGLVSAQ